jgi:hypothetical protein
MRYWLEWRDTDLTVSVSLGDRILARDSAKVKNKGRLMARLAFESSFDVWMEGWNPVWRPPEVRIPLGHAALWTVHTVPQDDEQDESRSVCLTIENASGSY